METIFLAYGYQDAERRLAGLVEQLLESHDVRPVTGEVLEGQPLTPAVKAQIDSTDGLVALLAPRDPIQGGFRPSTWVRDEYLYAKAQSIPAVAVVHPDVLIEGMHADDERVDFDPANPLPAFLKLGREFGSWRRTGGRRVKVRVLPVEIEDQIGLPGLQPPICRYRLIQEQTGEVMRDFSEAHLTLEPGGAFAYLDRVPFDALIELQLQFPQAVWWSKATPQWLHLELARN